MTKRIVVIAMGIMSTVLALAILWQFRIVVIYVLISLLVSATVRPAPGSQMLRHPVTRIQLILRYLAGIAVLVVLASLAGRFLAHDFQQLVQSTTEQSTWVMPEWPQHSSIQQVLFESLPTPNRVLMAFASQRDLVLATLLSFTEGLGGALSGLIIILFLSVYWSLNQNHFERLWLSLLPAEIRKRARFISRAIESDLGAYTRSKFIQSTLAVILLGLGYWLVGSPYPALLAITGGLSCFVPVIGSTLALAMPLLLGSMSSIPLGVLSVLHTVLVLLFLKLWVEPRLYKPIPDNPVLTVVILLAMADAFGLLGIVAAPPISIICQALWRFLVAEQITDAHSQVINLKDRYERLHTTVAEMEESPPPLVVSSMQRLTELIEKAEPTLDGQQRTEPSTVLRTP